MTNTESDFFPSLFSVPSLLVITLYKIIITRIDLCVILVYNLISRLSFIIEHIFCQQSNDTNKQVCY